MKFKCDFSIRHYQEVLEYGKKKYTFLTFSEFIKSSKKTNVILLRHDIDYSIEKALEMAKLESKMGIKSTYFVLLRGQFYNPYSIINTSHLKEIQNLGHEIGLHYDSTELSKEKSPHKKLKEEIKQLEWIMGKKISIVAQHNPTVSPKLKNIFHDVFDARESKIFKNLSYISDSVKNWRSRCMCNHIGEEETLQILIHPIWWEKTPKNIDKTLNGIVAFWKSEVNTAKKIHAKYLNDLKSKN